MRRYLPCLGIALLACGQSSIADPDVPPLLSSVLSLSAAADSIRVGNSLWIRATHRSTDGAWRPTPALAWTVDVPNVATIDGAGLLRAIAPGLVHISATGDGMRAALVVEVLSVDPSTVVLQASPDTIRLGGSIAQYAAVFAPANYRLPKARITWSSSQRDIATVSGGGVVTGVGVGKAVITARSGNAAATQAITVLPSVPGSVELRGLYQAIRPGDQVPLQALVNSTTGLPMDSTIVTWSSSQPGVATVSSTGLVVAISPGEATIIARAADITAQWTAVVLPVVGQAFPGANLIAFYRLTASDTSIEVRRDDGTLVFRGQVHTGTSGFDSPRLSIAPTGTSVAFDCPDGICDLSISTGTVTPRYPVCCSQERFAHPAWLRDGGTMVIQQASSYIAWLYVPTGMLISHKGPFYTDAPVPTPDGQFVFYRCEWAAQYDGAEDLCRMSQDGKVTLYHYGAWAPSVSYNGTMAYTRALASLDRVLVIEPMQLDPDPVGPGLLEYPGFADVSETAWSPDGSKLALLRNGQLWLASMPGVTGLTEFAHVPGTTIMGISWR